MAVDAGVAVAVAVAVQALVLASLASVLHEQAAVEVINREEETERQLKSHNNASR